MSMTLNEIIQKVLTDMGVPNVPLDCYGLKPKQAEIFVRQAIGRYNNISPIEVKVNVNLRERSHTFTDANTQTFRRTNGELCPYKGAPDRVLDAVPIRISGVYPFYLQDWNQNRTYLEIKDKYPWEYRNPTLTVPVSGIHDCVLIYNHRVVDQVIPSITIEDDHVFFDILLPIVMRAVGMSKRAFTLSEIPIETDGSDLVSEANSLLESLEEQLNSHKRIDLAWR